MNLMHTDDILRLLRAASSGYVSGANLATTLGVSRTAVWKRIRALERAGYGIEAVPSKGYRLVASPDRIDVEALRGRRQGGVIGREIVYRHEIPSTNTLATELAQQGAAEGTIVVAEQQTGGKGRLGRDWISPKGNLFVSIILRPPVPVHRAPLATLMGAVAVASAVRRRTGLHAGIKWPNDLLVNGRKVCGLLSEMSAEPDRVRHLVLGIGVNVNLDPAVLPPEVRTRSTSLAAESSGSVDRTQLLADLLEQLEHWYAGFLTGPDAVLSAWRELNVTLGRRVSVSGPGGVFDGEARDIDIEGRLIVRLDDGTERSVGAGDVTLLAPEAPETPRQDHGT